RDFHVTGVQTCALPIFAGTRGAEQSDDAAPLRPELRIKGETAKLMADGDVQCHRPASRWARRAKSSDSTSPERASAIDNPARRRSEERRVVKECRMWRA